MTDERDGDQPRRVLEWDAGVASERTVLAWERTAIASLAVAVLVVRAGIVLGLLGVAIPVAGLLAAAAVAEWLFARRIYAEHDRPYAEGVVVHDTVLFTVGAVTVIAAAGSILLAVGS